MTTSRGRSLYCGPWIMSPFGLTKGFITTPDLETTHSVSGMFCDAIKSDSKRLGGLGTIWEPNPQDTSKPLPTPPVPTIEMANPKWRSIWKAAPLRFLNKAAFYGATTLYVQKREHRYLGIMAKMKDGSRTILGQWDPSQTENISVLYEEQRNGVLDKITLILTGKYGNRQYVEDIILGDYEGTDFCFTWSDLSMVCCEPFFTYTSGCRSLSFIGNSMAL